MSLWPYGFSSNQVAGVTVEMARFPTPWCHLAAFMVSLAALFLLLLPFCRDLSQHVYHSSPKLPFKTLSCVIFLPVTFSI